MKSLKNDEFALFYGNFMIFMFCWSFGNSNFCHDFGEEENSKKVSRKFCVISATEKEMLNIAISHETFWELFVLCLFIFFSLNFPLVKYETRNFMHNKFRFFFLFNLLLVCFVRCYFNRHHLSFFGALELSFCLPFTFMSLSSFHFPSPLTLYNKTFHYTFASQCFQFSSLTLHVFHKYLLE